MTTDEQAALGRIEAQVTTLRAEMLSRFDRHEARHDALDDASRARQMEAEHRVTATETGLAEATRKLCAVQKAVSRRTAIDGVLVGLGAGAAWLAQQVGLGKPGP